MPIATPPRVRLRCLSADKLPRKTVTKRAQEKRIGRNHVLHARARGASPRRVYPVAELVRWLKEPGQNAKVAHAGVGSFAHLCGMLFAQEIGTTVTQVPYRGAGPALNDLLAGHADLGCQAAAVVGPLIKASKLKGYAILGKSRFSGLP